MFVHEKLVLLNPPFPKQRSDGFPLEFLLKKALKQNCEHSAKIANKLSQIGNKENYEDKSAFRGDFPWRMRIAKIDMLGTGEQCARRFWVHVLGRKGRRGGSHYRYTQPGHEFEDWRQIWRVAWRESGSPELLGSPRTSPEVPRTSPEVFRRLPRKFSHCGT